MLFVLAFQLALKVAIQQIDEHEVAISATVQLGY